MSTTSTPRTIKVVVIGDSGAGKTSFRNQYITGRFSSAYRATIGADFITKKLPHYANPEASVMLQIWDTAGQERFSALSTAFFRGADAAILLFDVTKPDSLQSLRKWWEEFAAKCPVPRETETEFCAVFVGNKIDLSPEHGSHVVEMNGNPNGSRNGARPLPMANSTGPSVTDHLAKQFLRDLIPLPQPSDPIPEQHTRRRTITMDGVSLDSEGSLDNSTTQPADIPHSNGHPRVASSDTEPEPESPPRSASRSRSIGAPSSSPRPPWLSRIKSRAFSREGNGTATTGYSVYHTPAASLFRTTSPVRGRPSPNQSQLHRGGSSVLSMETARSHFSSVTPTQPSRSRLVSYSSTTTTTSDATLKPQKTSDGAALPDLEETPTDNPAPEPGSASPETGPHLFWASARTGQGVSPVFEYIARRVVQRWEWEESRLGFDEGEDDDDGPTTLRLRDDWGKGKKSWKAACC